MGNNQSGASESEIKGPWMSRETWETHAAKLKLWDLLEFERRGYKYKHWAMYIGEYKGKPDQVIHVNAPKGISLGSVSSGSPGRNSDQHGWTTPKVEDLLTVAKDDRFRVNNKEHQSPERVPRSDSEVRQRIENHKNQWVMYSVLTSNCEHFATDLKFQEYSNSHQVVKIWAFVKTFSAGILILLLFLLLIQPLFRMVDRMANPLSDDPSPTDNDRDTGK